MQGYVCVIYIQLYLLTDSLSILDCKVPSQFNLILN